ncbi:Beta-lactamase-like protein [Fulvimarina pelagi HTCC2506]|uniref:Beta-lactamase-like protein n=2 Tax=Fulvimarina pelagi TaxID=217511 RepID=Q0FYF2_9HYPH|nr:MBL fold metallo-hydrolase [Fulvimarina pelagi]EAU40043.1 Beta-lactamase-like protein [Fulvimarina pelagi HTCC2506]BAT31085.1 beta-lactamase-like protein [Fulvimarina pelagi]
MAFSRRTFFAGAASAPVFVNFLTRSAAAQDAETSEVDASSTSTRVQALPIQRTRVGEHVVTAISDGYLDISLDLLTNIDADAATDLLASKFQGDPPVTTGINAYVVEMADRLVLIDTGGAGAFPEMGKLNERIRQAGFQPTDITDVLMTHLHPDHVGGLVIDGQLAFANANVHVHQTEFDYWTSTENRDAAPESARGFFDTARTAMETTGDKVQTFSGDNEVVPGITSRELFGHTPGHTGFMIGEAENGLFVWGDIVHVGPIQFARPDVGIAFDANPEQAIETRQRILEELASNRTRIAGMHIAFPSFGHVVTGDRENEAYRFIPSDWEYVIEG